MRRRSTALCRKNGMPCLKKAKMRSLNTLDPAMRKRSFCRSVGNWRFLKKVQPCGCWFKGYRLRIIAILKQGRPFSVQKPVLCPPLRIPACVFWQSMLLFLQNADDRHAFLNASFRRLLFLQCGKRLFQWFRTIRFARFLGLPQWWGKERLKLFVYKRFA